MTAALTAARDEQIDTYMLGGAGLLQRADLGRHDDAHSSQRLDLPLVGPVADRHERRRLRGADTDERVVLREGLREQAHAEVALLPRDVALLRSCRARWRRTPLRRVDRC